MNRGTIKSPRGLISNTVESDEATARWERINESTWTIKGPDSLKWIRDYLRQEHDFHAAQIKAAGQEPRKYMSIAKGDVLDRAAASAHVLRSISRIHHWFSKIEKMPDSQERRVAIQAVQEALLFATRFHQWTVIDNEQSIADLIRSREGGKKGPAARLANARLQNMDSGSRNRKMAEEYQEKRKSTSPSVSDTRLKAQIGKKHGLGRSAAVEAINAGLKQQ